METALLNFTLQRSTRPDVGANPSTVRELCKNIPDAPSWLEQAVDSMLFAAPVGRTPESYLSCNPIVSITLIDRGLSDGDLVFEYDHHIPDIGFVVDNNGQACLAPTGKFLVNRISQIIPLERVWAFSYEANGLTLPNQADPVAKRYPVFDLIRQTVRNQQLDSQTPETQIKPVVEFEVTHPGGGEIMHMSLRGARPNTFIASATLNDVPLNAVENEMLAYKGLLHELKKRIADRKLQLQDLRQFSDFESGENFLTKFARVLTGSFSLEHRYDALSREAFGFDMKLNYMIRKINDDIFQAKGEGGYIEQFDGTFLIPEYLHNRRRSIQWKNPADKVSILEETRQYCVLFNTLAEENRLRR